MASPFPPLGAPYGAQDQAPQGTATQNKLSAALQPIIDLLQEDGELDPQELVAVEDFRTKVMKILADRQKSSDGMLQGKIDPRAMRRLGG